MQISQQDHERIANAIQAAEAKTSGQIVCVLAETSSPVTALPIFMAALAALATPWLLMAFTAMTVQRMLSLQLVVFILLLMLLCLPRVEAALMPRKARRVLAHRLAMQQFVSRGLGGKGRTGILIFVSLAERYARIVADDEISARVPQAEWQAAVDALVAHMRDGRIADGFIKAIDLCGDHLGQHFPRGALSGGALPNRIYVI